MNNPKPDLIAERTVERLCAYRQILFQWSLRGKERFYSHELAEEANITSAQVRRDLMSLKTIGTPSNGYGTANLIEELGLIIQGEKGQNVILVGLGNLGNSILSYFRGRRPDVRIIAAFDNDPKKVGKAHASCPCFPMSELGRTVLENGVIVGILTVPGSAAQETATALADAGIKAIVNFAPVRIKVPDDVFVEDIDISIAIEKSAYFGRKFAERKKGTEGQEFSKDEGRPAAKLVSMKKILLVTDDKDIVGNYKAILQDAGYEVDVAFGGESGLERAKEKKPDLIIFDVAVKDSMEDFHGVSELRSDPKLSSVPILTLGTVGMEQDLRLKGDEDGGRLPNVVFIGKTAAPQALLATVERLLSLPQDQVNVEGVGKKKGQ